LFFTEEFLNKAFLLLSIKLEVKKWLQRKKQRKKLQRRKEDNLSS
jgi:hypothetical protein